MHGHGTYVYNSGAKYIGSFAVDKMHGEGALYFLDGTSYRGFWINGIADKTTQSDDDHQDKSLYFSNHNNNENTPSSDNVVLHRSRSLFTPERKNASRAHVHEDNYDDDVDVVIEVHRTSQSDRKAAKVIRRLFNNISDFSTFTVFNSVTRSVVVMLIIKVTTTTIAFK